MIDDAGAAPAAAEPLALPENMGEIQTSGEAGTWSDDTAVDRSKETARSSIDRAFAEIEKQDADETDARSTHGRWRDEQGRFTAKEPGTVTDRVKSDSVGQGEAVKPGEPPARFSPDAKAAWREVPDPVKGEVGRALRELEGGLTQYQQIFEPLRPYFQMAQERGVTIHDALRNYISLDMALVSPEPKERLGAIEHLLDCAGISPRDYAAFIMGQRPDEAQSLQDQTVRELRQQVASLHNHLGGVTRSIQQRHVDETLRQVEAFAEANSRLKELEFANMVARLLETSMASDLQGAYEMAERLSPSAVAGAHPAASFAANPKSVLAQTRNGNLSVTGAPGSGSNPAKRKAPSTARESVDSAFASLGLG